MRVSSVWSRRFFGVFVGAGVASAIPCHADDGAAAAPVLTTVRVVGDESGTAGKELTIVAGTVVGTEGAANAPKADGAPKRITIRVVGDVATVVDAAEVGAAEAGAAAGGGAEAGAAAARKLVPYIGVATSPLAPAVRAQTGLPEDVGLAVDAVTPGSPAAAAGLVPFDILAKYDDQILCAAVQLSALVKRTGTGKTATLTVLRGGKEITVPVKIGEREADVTMQMVTVPGIPGGGGGAGMAIANLVPGQPLDPKLLERLASEAAKNAGGMWQGQLQGLPLPGGYPGIVPPAVPPVPVPGGNQRWLFIAPGGPAGGGAPGGIGGAVPGAGASAQTQSQSIAVFADGDGRVEFRDTNGKKRVSVFGADGSEQYSGAFDTDADKANVPEALRDRVAKAAASTGNTDSRPQPLKLKKMSL